MAGINLINPESVKAQTLGKSSGGSGRNFNAFLDAATIASDAAAPAAVTSTEIYGSPESATVLRAAFSGMNTLGQQAGAASYAKGYGYRGDPVLGSGPGQLGLPGSGDEVVPGTGYSQAEMINTMHQNNLRLLELQAVMQANLQEANTKSSILASKHRAEMAIITQFNVR